MSIVANLGKNELQALYRELILDHAKNPRHFGRLANGTHTAQGINPLCGDKLTVYLAVDDDATIEEASFEGSGCAISVASASMMTDLVIGLSTAEAATCFGDITSRLTEGGTSMSTTPSPRFEKLRALEGVREFPSRVKCATLAWHALDAAIQESSASVSTE
jgi:nitrogen fixation NifU-like protein